MLLASELSLQLNQLVKCHGDRRIVVQGDSEGNSYDYARGLDMCFISEDLERTYDTLLEADVQEESQGMDLVYVIYP